MSVATLYRKILLTSSIEVMKKVDNSGISLTNSGIKPCVMMKQEFPDIRENKLVKLFTTKESQRYSP